MKKINKILIDVLKISETDALKNLGMDDVNEWDSLTHMGLIVAIEDEFRIELSGDDIAEMVTFESIKKTVSKYL